MENNIGLKTCTIFSWNISRHERQAEWQVQTIKYQQMHSLLKQWTPIFSWNKFGHKKQAKWQAAHATKYKHIHSLLQGGTPSTISEGIKTCYQDKSWWKNYKCKQKQRRKSKNSKQFALMPQPANNGHRSHEILPIYQTYKEYSKCRYILQEKEDVTIKRRWFRRTQQIANFFS